MGDNLQDSLGFVNGGDEVYLLKSFSWKQDPRLRIYIHDGGLGADLQLLGYDALAPLIARPGKLLKCRTCGTSNVSPTFSEGSSPNTTMMSPLPLTVMSSLPLTLGSYIGKRIDSRRSCQ